MVVSKLAVSVIAGEGIAGGTGYTSRADHDKDKRTGK